MGRFQKIMLAGVVWLTAAMTVVAGTPQLACVCLKEQAGPGGCACGQASKTPAVLAESLESADACPHCTKAGRPDSSCHLSRLPCKKAVTLPDSQAVSPNKTASAPAKLALDAVTPLVLSSDHSPIFHGDLTWQRHLLPPPTDRIIAFQRLLI